ncbi:pyocin knob domain-containing protein [Paenibacillus peoriae]|uniref:pyocin knob domain-containing protein n=1 Tax=Paenibacillus peoriae TaxID=59893 RepID=UPI003F95BDC0
MANTDKLGLPLIEPNMTANVPRDMNALAEAVDAKVGVAGGLAVLGADGKVPADQLNVKDPVDASLTQKGIVQLTNATNSTSEVLAPTAKALKAAYDLANSGLMARTTSATDFNNITAAGVYTIGDPASMTNNPGIALVGSAIGWGMLIVFVSSNYIRQSFHSLGNGGIVFERGRSEGVNTWTEWRQQYTTRGGRITGTIDSTNEVPLAIYRPGKKSWVIHKSDGTGNVYISPSNSVDGVDWNFGKGLQIGEDNISWSGGDLNSLKTSVVDGKGAVAGAINGKGGSANGSNTFAELAAAITNLPVKRFASGTFNGQSAQAASSAVGIDMTVSVSLPFTVNRVFIRVVLEDTQGTSTSRQVDGVVMTSSVFNDNKSAKGWRNNYVTAGYLEPPIQGFNVKLSGSRIDAYAGGSPIAKISAYEWWAYE